VVEVVAGGGTSNPDDGGPATGAKLSRPAGLAIGADGTLWFTDSNFSELFKVSDGEISTVTRRFAFPVGADLGSNGKVYVADSQNYRVVTPTTNGNVAVLAGGVTIPGYGGDGGLATHARLLQPYDVSVDTAGDIYIADTGNDRIRVIDAVSGRIHTVAGNGVDGFNGDTGTATSIELSRPQAIAVNASGTALYIADTGNRLVRLVDLATGTISTVAGNGADTGVTYNPALTGLQTTLTRLNAISLDQAGNVYLPVFYSDRGNVVMQLHPDGTMSLVVGGGNSTDPGVAPADFAFTDITGLEVEPVSGDLYVASALGRVYRVAGIAPHSALALNAAPATAGTLATEE
jgi:sugar lactone lactonase YvrE